TLRDRFADWDEFKQHRARTLKAEAGLFERVYLTDDGTLENYRKYALTYSDHMTPKLISEVTKRELAEASVTDELEMWSALEARYPFAWAKALNKEAKRGVVLFKIQQAVRANTKYAFNQLSAEYAEAPQALKYEITNAECTWILDQIRLLSDTRQPIKGEQAIYLMRRMRMSQDCVDRVQSASTKLVESAATAGLWLNRILRRVGESTNRPSLAVMGRVDEASEVWRTAQSSNRVEAVQTVIDWYPDLATAAEADRQLVKLAELASKRESRMKVRVHATQSRRRNRQMSLLSLQDRFHGQVEVTKQNLRLSYDNSAQEPSVVVSVKPSTVNYAWFGGRLATPKDVESFRSMWIEYKRYYSIYDRTLKAGVVTKRKRRLRWKEFNDLDRLVEQLGQATRNATLDLVSAVSKALTRRSIGTKVFYFGTPESDFLFSDCRQSDSLAKQACQRKILSSFQRKPLDTISQQLGILPISESKGTSLGAQFAQLGMTSLPIEALDGDGPHGARTFEVLYSHTKPAELKPPDFEWSPELVWHWADEQESASASKADAATAESTTSEQSDGLINGTLKVFSSKTGEVGVVTSEQTKSKVLYLPGDNTRWRLVSTIPDSNSRTVLYASVVMAEEMKVIRVVFPDMTMDWHLGGKVWRTSRTIQGVSDVPTDPSVLSLPSAGQVWGLPNRMGVAIMADPKDGVWRTFNGGISWVHSEKGRRFSQLRGYYRHNAMICAHVTVVDSNVTGVECSSDDGLSWQRLLTGTQPIRLVQRGDEMVVMYGNRALRLAYLIDEGKIRRDLLFVGHDQRLSQTGQWFGNVLKDRVSKSKDRLLVSHPLVPPVSQPPGEPKPPVQGLSMKRVSAELFDQNPEVKLDSSHWRYAILGPVNNAPVSD
ncbi:MAG: hypothetical protein ACPGQS_09475, partial [Bradymonadia bacterium]